MYASTALRTSNFISSIGTSSVPNPKTGQVRDYDNYQNQIGMSVVDDPIKFQEVDSEFKRLKDRSGVPLTDIARRYWSDPEYQEHQRREIADLKRRHGRS